MRESIYVPYIVGHFAMLFIVAPLLAPLVYIPFALLYGRILPSIVDGCIFFFSGCLAGAGSTLFLRRGYESLFVLVVPVLHWISWMDKLSASLGLDGALNEWLRAFYTSDYKVDGAIGLYLELSTIGYFVGGLARTRLGRKPGVSGLENDQPSSSL
jgi:hypothetical protein